MKTSRMYIEQMRRRAREHLPPTFARDVIQAAAQQRRMRRHLRIAFLTGALCVIASVSVHWLQTGLTERRNVEAWKSAAAQVHVLEESI